MVKIGVKRSWFSSGATVSAVLSIAFVLSACVAADTGDAEVGTTADNRESEVDTSVNEEVDGSESGQSRTVLEIADPQEPGDLFVFDRHGGKITLFQAMLPELLTLDEAGEPVSPVLESWEASEDNQTATLILRSDVAWSDGTPLTSADVVTSLTFALDSSVARNLQALGGDDVVEIAAPDENTVTVELETPASVWLAKLAAERGDRLVPDHILGDVAPGDLESHEYFETFPVTYGPYLFVEWQQGQHIELERNDAWSLGEAGFERLFIKYADMTVTAAQIETGEVQLTYITPADAERIGSLDGIEVQSKVAPDARSINLMHLGPLADQRVRQAMVYAIDRQAICESALYGFCSVSDANLPLVGPEWAMPDDVIEYKYDPDRARELLEEAGWDPATELILLLHDAPGSEPAQAVEIAVGNMAEVGINWSVQNVEYPVLAERTLEAPESFHGWRATTGDIAADPSLTGQLLACQDVAGWFNGLYCNEEIDALWSAGRVETDTEKRAEIYQEAFRLLNADVPTIYLHVPEYVVAYDSRLQGVRPSSGYLTWNIGEWRWDN